MKQLSRIGLVLSAVASAFSVPIAYAFGLTIPMSGSGVVSFIDSAFIASEISNLIVVLVGAAAFGRITIVMLGSIATDFLSWKNSSDSSKLRKYLSYLFAGFAVALIFAVVAGPFIGRKLLFSFFLSTFMIFGMCVVLYSVSLPAARSLNAFDDWSYNLGSIKSKLKEPHFIFALSTLALLFSINLGYFRLLSLAISSPGCIELSNGELESVSIVGITAHGVITSSVQSGDFLAMTIPTGLPILKSSVFSFTNMDAISSFKSSCSA